MHQLGAPTTLTSAPRVSDSCPIVFVIDDDSATRTSVEQLGASIGWRTRCFASPEELFACPPSATPSCLVLNLRDLELQHHLGDRPEMPIAFVTDLADVPMTVQAMKAGAVGVLTKPFSARELLGFIQQGLERSQRLIAQQSATRELKQRFASLTTREREVMGLVVSGLLNKQTGGELGIHEMTVKAHRRHLMHKMGANCLADLIKMALSLGLPSPNIRVVRSVIRHYSDRVEPRIGRDPDAAAPACQPSL